MLQALERKPLEGSLFTSRLTRLVDRFRAQEAYMAGALHDLQAQLEFWHREACFHQLDGPEAAAPILRRCTELQAECDHLAVELVHVRMAISGAGDELADRPESPTSRRLGA
jgi:hypothetical protein